MEKVAFLDRDGTINAEVNYLHKPVDLKILDGVPEAIRLLREAGYCIVVVTNQAGVGRGYYGEEDVQNLHVYMNELLAKDGATVDHFFYCPHHPDGVGEYRKVCHCRKPETGMFEMAEQYYEIDKAHSWMVGDKLIDAQAGLNFGVHGALVGTGYGAKEHEKAQAEGNVPYEIYGENLLDVVKQILEKEKSGC